MSGIREQIKAAQKTGRKGERISEALAPGEDLSGYDLRKLSLVSCDLSSADLRGARLPPHGRLIANDFAQAQRDRWDDPIRGWRRDDTGRLVEDPDHTINGRHLGHGLFILREENPEKMRKARGLLIEHYSPRVIIQWYGPDDMFSSIQIASPEEEPYLGERLLSWLNQASEFSNKYSEAGNTDRVAWPTQQDAGNRWTEPRCRAGDRD
ncbi:hypothetical protein MRY87_13490 [bacterium]|nr:hypothetical protein [bacterium]